MFLDEIAEIPAAQQVKLLRLLESGSYRRVGSVELQRADFRLVCATHQPLEKAVEEGKFRLDLFYRINTFPINIPALRERKADLPALCRYFLRGSGKSLSAAAERVLQGHDFPGNIRELRNILHRASLLADGTVVDAHHLGIATTVDPAFSGDIVTLEQAERDYLRWALRHHQGDRSELASLLGVSERTLYRKLATLEGDEMR